MKSRIIIMMLLAFLISLPVSAATLLQYNFETDMAGNPGAAGAIINGTGDPNPAIPDLSGNGNDMWIWRDSSVAFSADTADGSGLSAEFFGNQDGYTTTSINSWSPETWTIELSVNLGSIEGWKTIVGRDGSSNGSPSDFYFQNTGIDDRFRVDFATASGGRVTLDSDFIAVADQWYKFRIVSDGTEVTMYCDKLGGNGYQNVGSMVMTGTPAENAFPASEFGWTFGRGWWDGGQADMITGKIDDIRFTDQAFAPGAAYGPNPVQLNDDGSVGALIGDDAVVTLNFQAAADPCGIAVVDPNVLTHYIYLSTSLDPTPVYLVSVPQTDPDVSDVTYGLLTLVNNTVYYWMVEEGQNDGTGNAYPAGDSRNVVSATWSFTTIAAIPSIISGPENTVADPDATLTVVGSPTATAFKWFKVGESADVQLTDAGVFSGTETAELVVTGATLADEGYYYCIAYNGELPSEPSPEASLILARLVGHWKFEGNLLDSVAETVPGAPVHDGAIAVSSFVAGPGDENYASDISETGIDGDAAWFNNDGDFVEIPDSYFFNFYHQSLTVSCWYKMDVAAGWVHPIIKIDADAPGVSGFLYGLDFNNRTNLNVIFENALAWPGLDSDNGASDVDFSDGQWHMMTVTYDGATARLYGDGVLADQSTVNFAGLSYPDSTLKIGGSGLDGNNGVQGGIDDVKMYSYALTSTEVAEMYTGFNPGVFICVDEIGMSAYDLTKDCRVNIEDLAVLVVGWLECQRVPVDSCNW